MLSEEEESSSKQDLDAFLIGVESKLRGPFSSLDVSRAVSSAQSPPEYLQTLAKVLPRMDKVVQLRVLVGLLGVPASEQTDGVIHSILTQAQEAPLYEQWVRVAAGLVQGMIFSRPESDRDVGEEAEQQLNKTCQDILKRGPSSADMDPLFAPYYYSLLNPETLQRILPDCLSNPHFSINEDAEILKQEDKMEHGEPHAVASSSSRAEKEGGPSKKAAPPPVIMPGRNALTSSSKPKPVASKSSMFLPSRKTAAAVVAGRPGQQLTGLRNLGLHARKAGAAQKLLGKSLRMALTANSTTSGSCTSTIGASGGARSSKLGNNRSKMKVIDITEVQGLTKEHQEREAAGTREQKMSARKRRIMEAAAAKGLISAKSTKRSRPGIEEDPASFRSLQEHATVPSNSESGQVAAMAMSNGAVTPEAFAAAALLAYHHQQPDGETAPVTAQAAPTQPVTADRMALAPGNEQELNVLLQNSNKLSEENRQRVRQFWIDRFNPTPDVPVYRMKLHEEKSVDPETGMTVKETDYLELDYNTFGYKKLRKTKKK